MSTKELWIVASDEPYYPWVNEYDTYEDAEKQFTSSSVSEGDSIYLCRVFKKRSAVETLTEY